MAEKALTQPHYNTPNNSVQGFSPVKLVATALNMSIMLIRQAVYTPTPTPMFPVTEPQKATLGECLTHEDKYVQQKAVELYLELVRVREETESRQRVVGKLVQWDIATKASRT